MGNFLTVNMSENFKKNQEFIQSINKIKMERQIQLQYQMQERQMAMIIAKNRDTCLWFTVFAITATTGLVAGYRKTKTPYFLMPLVPLTFATLYQWDLAYGNKIHRIRNYIKLNCVPRNTQNLKVENANSATEDKVKGEASY